MAYDGSGGALDPSPFAPPADPPAPVPPTDVSSARVAALVVWLVVCQNLIAGWGLLLVSVPVGGIFCALGAAGWALSAGPRTSVEERVRAMVFAMPVVGVLLFAVLLPNVAAAGFTYAMYLIATVGAAWIAGGFGVVAPRAPSVSLRPSAAPWEPAVDVDFSTKGPVLDVDAVANENPEHVVRIDDAR